MTEASASAVDTSECAKEPVHIPGAIQPFGCLVALSLPTWSIAHVSTNASVLFGCESPEAMIGARMETILSPQIIHDLRNVFQAAMISGFAERLPLVVAGVANETYDILIHSSGSYAIAEFIPMAGADTMRADPTSLVKTIIDRLRRTTTFQTFLTSAARQIRAVTGYDRVMIYQFLEDDSGQVVAEALRMGMTPFMGLRYPASDIPPQARALFKRHWLRMIPAVEHQTIPIIPLLTDKKLPLDLSQSTLRAASPTHLEYLRNMGSGATLTVSIMIGDRLWGLIACHHEVPRRISATTCAAVELFAQVFSTQIEAKQQNDDLAQIAKARETHDRLLAAMEPEETIFDNLRRFGALLRDMIACDGIGVWAGGRFEGEGITPPVDAIADLVHFLNAQRGDRAYATSALGDVFPDAMSYADKVSGLIAIPISRAPKDFLLLFRREVVQIVTWGGDPNKVVVPGGGGLKLGPRASFEAWKEYVSGTAVPWKRSEIEIAEALRVSLLDIILRRANIIDAEKKIAQENQLLIVAELNHRVKNVLAVIRSLVRQSRRGSQTIEEFAHDLQSRIQALSIAHDQLTQGNWKAASLRNLIKAEADAWTNPGDPRLVLTGPGIMIEARAYQTLALVLHEMMTNAAKYGALSVPAGRLDLSWTQEMNGDLAMSWVESNGPPVVPPKRRGFGSIVVEQSIPFELHGTASIEHRPDGTIASFMIPAAFVTKGDDDLASAPLPSVARADLNGKNLLLVEDSMMIAFDAQAMLQDCGADVEIAATSSDARRALKLSKFDAAILDVNLYTDTSFGVAEDLQDLAIPFVFATGYGETVTVPDRFKDIPVLSKPYIEDALRAALAS